jgi:hypothetical protein
MSRGDKRDRDRAKNLAKQQAKAKSEAKVGDSMLFGMVVLVPCAWQ